MKTLRRILKSRVKQKAWSRLPMAYIKVSSLLPLLLILHYVVCIIVPRWWLNVARIDWACSKRIRRSEGIGTALSGTIAYGLTRIDWHLLLLIFVWWWLVLLLHWSLISRLLVRRWLLLIRRLVRWCWILLIRCRLLLVRWLLIRWLCLTVVVLIFAR